MEYAMAIPQSAFEAWHGFLKHVEDTSRLLANGSDDDIWFRGHTRTGFPLLPSLFRGYKEPNE